MPEIRLVCDGCGHVDRWDVTAIPPDEDVERHMPTCQTCRGDLPPSVEELAQAQYELERPQRRRRHK